MKPNFLFIGADKTGSTWLYQILRAHPECFVPKIKDIYFFDRYYDKGSKWYESLFNNAPVDAVAIGELSHDYLFSEEAPKRIANDLPGVKIIASLRNPVERTFSHYLYMVRGGVIQEPLSPALGNFPELIRNSLYSQALQNYYSVFDKSQMKILFFEDLKADPEKYAKMVFEFLNISYIPDLPYREEVLSATQPRNRLLSRAVKIGANFARKVGLPQLVGILKYSSLRNVLFSPFSDVKKPELTPEDKTRLIDIFREDISQLSELLDMDLSNWLR